MNTQVIHDTVAYIITELDSNESWLLARVELCNGSYVIIKGRETRLYTTRRRFEQAWKAMWNEETTMEQVAHTLRHNGIRTHSWCMVD